MPGVGARGPVAAGLVASWGALCASAPALAQPTPHDDDDLASLQERLRYVEAETRRLGLEAEERKRQELDDGSLRIGGAMWLNYAYKDFSGVDTPPGGEANLDLIRLSVDGARSDVLISLQYRWYPYMHVVHHAWVGYDISPSWQIQAGVVRVPFGLQPYASHSYWFGVPYYLGFEDDYDTGVSLIGDLDPLDVQIAALKNSEWGIGSKTERYSFDVVPTDQSPQTEINQLNARVTYDISFSEAARLQVGASGMAGHLLNTETYDVGYRWAAAGHTRLGIGGFTLELQGIRYELVPDVGPGQSEDLLHFGAFASLRQVATRGSILVGNVAYRLDVDTGPLDSVTCYNDTSALVKDESGYDDSWLNTTGCMVVLGPTYTYVDLIQGYNMTFLNDSFERSGLGPGGTSEVERRFNVNVEYYF